MMLKKRANKNYRTEKKKKKIISKHKGIIKFHFYTNDSQVYIHISEKNASAAFEKLNRCLDNVKEWMSTSKLKLNPDHFWFEETEGQVESMFSN